MTPRAVILYIAVIVVYALLFLGLWIAGAPLVRAGVDLAPVPDHRSPGEDAIHFTVEAVHGGSAAQQANLLEAIATELALTGRHHAAAHRKVRIAVLVVVERGAPECVLKRKAGGQLVVVTWVAREGPLGAGGRKLGSVGQVQCRSAAADVWAEIARYGVPLAVKGILELVDGAGAAAVKDERDV